jgi:ABC transport system ATP-binding/permease protein
MSRPLPPTITVRFGGWQRTFAPGADVVIGRDVRADVRLPHPAVSRAHVLLRYLDGRWVATDNDSRNGMFLGQRRVYSVDVRSSETIHLGDPEGPRLTFEPGPVPRPDDQPTTRMRQEADRGPDVSSLATTVLPAHPRDVSGAEPPGPTTIG